MAEIPAFPGAGGWIPRRLRVLGGGGRGLLQRGVAVGALAIHARHMATSRLPAGLMRLGPVVSAGCIAVVGLVLTVRGLVRI